MTLIPLWLPILLTLLFFIMLFSPFDFPGFLDEAIVAALALGAWLAYLGNVLVKRAVDSVLAGDITSIIFILLTIAGIAIYIKKRK